MTCFDPWMLGVLLASATLFGIVLEESLASRAARRDRLCPTCIGPVDDEGTSKAWGED